jgi:hypothetical protein
MGIGMRQPISSHLKIVKVGFICAVAGLVLLGIFTALNRGMTTDSETTEVVQTVAVSNNHGSAFHRIDESGFTATFQRGDGSRFTVFMADSQFPNEPSGKPVAPGDYLNGEEQVCGLTGDICGFLNALYQPNSAGMAKP